MQSIMKKTFLFATIFLVAAAMGLTLTVDHTYAAAKKAPEKIVLKTQAKTVDVGGKVKVSVSKTTPKKASKNVTWKITKGKKYAKLVNQKNASVYVKGKKAGGTITLQAVSKADKKVAKTITMKVKNLKAKKLKLDTKSLKVAKGRAVMLGATAKAPQKYGYKVQKTKWKSSNTKIAKVSKKGVVKGKAAGTAKITASSDGKTATCKVKVAKGKTLQPFVLAGTYTKSKVNYTALESNTSVALWDKSSKKFKTAKNKKSVVLGNIVQLQDLDSNGKADIVNVVKRADSTAKWNKNMTWKNGIGTKVEPAIADADAKAIYGAENRIPFGERQLTQFGISDYCGVNDFAQVENSAYWPAYDYYNLKSGGSLTLLEGYKSQNQSTGANCVMTSAVSVLDWYGVRGDLNEFDLATLRGSTKQALSGGTSLEELECVYKNLEKLGITGKWKITDSNNAKGDEGLFNPEWIQSQLKQGHPIQVIWNSYGPHGQVIIGYDDMGTENSADDQLILMDPYDTTDHTNDGYVIQSYQRLAYGLLTWTDGTNQTKYLVAEPQFQWSYTPSSNGGLEKVASNKIVDNDTNSKLDSKVYGQTKTDLAELMENKKIDSDWVNLTSTGLGGPAGWARTDFDVDQSPYYSFKDYYDYENSANSTLTMVENFKTVQQATEWTCGCTSSLMVMEYFNRNGTSGETKETEIDISNRRQDGDVGATTLKGMNQIFDKDAMDTAGHGSDWVSFDRNDLSDPDGEWSEIKGHALQGGKADGGLIPYLLENQIPIMIGSDEWGGHWQVIVGYDSMGTDQTQDDVLILADPYDTTDHNFDGYVVKGFERLVYGWGSAFDEADGNGNNDFIVAFPKDANEQTKAVADELGLN